MALAGTYGYGPDRTAERKDDAWPSDEINRTGPPTGPTAGPASGP
jgi:hypothetical protein